MTSAFTRKSVVILTAQYNDWISLAHLLPLIDEHLVSLGVRACVVVVDDGSIDHDGRELLAGLSLKAVESIEEVVLGDNQGNQRAMATIPAIIFSSLTAILKTILNLSRSF